MALFVYFVCTWCAFLCAFNIFAYLAIKNKKKKGISKLLEFALSKGAKDILLMLGLLSLALDNQPQKGFASLSFIFAFSKSQSPFTLISSHVVFYHFMEITRVFSPYFNHNFLDLPLGDLFLYDPFVILPQSPF